jgi:uncharacterized protein YxjI
MSVGPGRYTITESNFMAVGGSNFFIADEDGNQVIESDSALFTFHDTMVAKFSNGGEAFTLKRKLLSLRTAYCIMQGGNTIATLQRNLFSLKNTVCVYKGEDTGADPMYTVSNDFCRKRNLTFLDADGEECATSHEECCNVSLCGGDKYDVDVEDNADALIVFATILAIDEINEDQDGDNN